MKTFLSLVLALLQTLALAQQAPPAAQPAGPVTPEAMQGVSFEGLTDEQKQLAVAILNENGCDCGCSMKLAVCRRDDAKCGRSLALANQVVQLVKQGQGRDAIVKTALSPPSKFVEFPLEAGVAPYDGPPDAKVTILHYTDYQCPFCAKVGPTLEQIRKDYPGDVRIVYKMHPLPMHAQAMVAAEAAMAAKAQGKFLEMHRKLFANQSALSREKVLALAQELGLDMERFTRELDAHAHAAEIQQEAKEVEDLGASGTPGSFVNGRYLSGAKPYTAFKEIIDEELGWARAGNRPKFTVGKNVRDAAAQSAAKGPDPSTVYDLPVGDSPFRGSPTAKVTVQHYLDYQ